MTSEDIVFPTDRRIRMGVWGLGRGLDIIGAARAVNIDVVAGCDTNPHFQEAFRRAVPDGPVTADAETFLSWDIDAVLVATYLPNHAEHVIAALAAGKHVLSEVTAFFTCADGVRLVEAVESSGRIYQLAENYPYTRVNRYLARRWSEGFFGDLQYAEYSYVHDCLHLAYTYIDRTPVVPGHTVHAWRSWLPWHYYCTHSIGPVMVITGERPAEVVALPGSVRLPGHLIDPPDGLSGMAASLVRFGNGGVMRNLMGSSTLDSDVQRLWGTRAASDYHDRTLRIRPGGRGHSPGFVVEPPVDPLDTLAEKTGHGGGDFWTLYHFANQILNGVVGPFDVYRAADVTLPGIQAYRSAVEGGRPQPVPDFRSRAERDRYRDDTFMPGPYDPRTLAFGGFDARDAAPDTFTDTMTRLLDAADIWQEARHGALLFDDACEPEAILSRADRLIDRLSFVARAVTDAVRLIDDAPVGRGTAALAEVLARIDRSAVAAPDCRSELLHWRDSLADRLPDWAGGPDAELPTSPQLHMRRVGFDALPPLDLPAGYTLRCARGDASDAEAWCAIIGESFEESLTADDFRTRIEGRGGYSPERLFFIDDPDGVACATAGAFGANDEGYVHYVGVRPSHAGHRLGYWVSLAVLHSFRDRGCPSCWLTTDDPRAPALKTYHRLGFRPMITHRSHRRRWHRLADTLGIDAFRV